MNMRERLARSISGAPFPSKAAYRKADAVLDELMTPTIGMVSEGQESVYSGPASSGPVAVYLTTGSFQTVFTTMIKAAKEGK